MDLSCVAKMFPYRPHSPVRHQVIVRVKSRAGRRQRTETELPREVVVKQGGGGGTQVQVTAAVAAERIAVVTQQDEEE